MAFSKSAPSSQGAKGSLRPMSLPFKHSADEVQRWLRTQHPLHHSTIPQLQAKPTETCKTYMSASSYLHTPARQNRAMICSSRDTSRPYEPIYYSPITFFFPCAFVWFFSLLHCVTMSIRLALSTRLSVLYSLFFVPLFLCLFVTPPATRSCRSSRSSPCSDVPRRRP